MLTGRIRKGQQTDLRRATLLKAFSDERRLDAVEQIISLAAEAALPMTHLATAFAIAHPAEEILDRIDEIVPPGTDVGTLGQAYLPPALTNPSLRRRPAGERAAS